jgi:hypothetical protein
MFTQPRWLIDKQVKPAQLPLDCRQWMEHGYRADYKRMGLVKRIPAPGAGSSGRCSLAKPSDAWPGQT